MNIDFVKLCGKHTPIYEAYYKQMDPKGTGTIEAMAAAKFLKKSGLSDVVLSRVWDLSDPNGKGFLDKPGFFVALKLVSLAQAGHVYNMNNIYMDTEKPPKVGDIPKIMPPRVPAAPVVTAAPGAAPTGDWTIRVIDRLKYEQLFESLKPVGGMLPGNKVKGVLLDSKLPMDTLGKIWDLADQDKDGNLDKHEFIVAMHLVYKTLEKRTVPDVLPVELRKPGGVPPPKPAPPAMPRAPSSDGFGDGGFVANFPKDIGPPAAIPIPPPAIQRVPPVGGPATVGPLISTDPLIPIGAPPSVTANADWVVGTEEYKRFEAMFREADRDKDGLVSGLEVKNVFLQSGVPQKMLAHIWALCDTNQSGKLTLEQFALAMWMVERKQKGIDPPQVLTANMVPPSMRGIVSGVDVQAQEQKPTYTNPELEMISKEIEELAKERRALETEIAQKEADIRIKNGEVRSLQSELDTLSATLKQLENQRGEAQKRLDDLQAQVNKIREQCQKQEETINEQEGELNNKRSELQKLKDEENSLQKEYDENNRELQKLTNHLQNTQLQISSIRSMVTQLMETQRQMTDALLMCRAAIDAENAELVSEYQLKIEPDFDEARKQLEKEIEMPKDDPFNDTNTTAMNNKNNGFATNGFDIDPFASSAAPAVAKGGFDDSFNTGFDASFDAFGSSSNTGFGGDAFGGSAFGSKPAEPVQDNFDSDPFASLHAPTGQGQILSPNTQTQATNLTASNKSGPPPRPESPSPALPPKKSKVPPPRPAPPRPMQAPNRPTQPEGFGSAGGFADFADFDTKAPVIPPPLPTISYKNVTNSNKTKTSNTSLSSNSSSSVTNLSLFENFTLTPPTPPSVSNSKTQTSSLTTTINTKTTTLTTTTLGSNSNLSKSMDNSLADIFQKATSTATFTSKTPTLDTENDIKSMPNSTLASSSSASPLPSAIESNTNSNNHLTSRSRSTTPKQLAASSTTNVFDAFSNPKNSTTTTSNNNNPLPTVDNYSTIKSVSSIISGPTEFNDDPFKDYRYEDPFNIKDPFADDDEDFTTDPDKVFKDDISSDDDKNKTSTNNNTTQDSIQTTSTYSSAASSNAFGTAKSNSTLSSDFLNQFESFTLNTNPSPVPSHHSSSSSAFTGMGGMDNANAGSKSKSNTPVPIGTNNNSTNLFDNFADFDAFSVKSNTSTMESNKKTKITTNSNGKTTNSSIINKDAFFDAFNDNFETNSNKSFDSNSNPKKPYAKSITSLDAFDDAFAATETKSSRQSPFDAFGGGSNVDGAFGGSGGGGGVGVGAKEHQITAAAMFDAFNDNNFEDDFFKNSNLSTNTALKETNLNKEKLQNKSPISFNQTIDNFAKFDAFPNDNFNNNSMLNNNQKFSLPPAPTTKKSFSSKSSSSSSSSSLPIKRTENLLKVQNQTLLTAVSNTDKAAASLAENGAKEKFLNDYSKPETFDDDLQEAIKRSMIDQ
ncbi:epidermal growth factor receptor substrate 15-like 1 isoform X2 [Stomoxys calcitrans]|uniref:epidermal growth factor receptor substrate 15-like 1 isoform X2 n=1 Tax=Stomoxys calcitrans TaxID=35570 RepID=UPI0027E22F47|nr:epidermal growth factor receptor substrate 15-like 1 isoform X2 [Stomoxys calcitrans]